MAELHDAIWRQVQGHRDFRRTAGLNDDEQLLIPLILSLARLAAQRDARAATQPVEADAVE